MLKRENVRLGITPTGWTNDDMPLLGDWLAFEQVVSEIALAGFEGCSVGHNFPTDVNVLKPALDLRDLQVSEPWASTYFAANNMWQQTVDSFKERLQFIKALGGTDLVVAELTGAVHQQPVALFPNKPVFSDDQWQAITNGLDELGRIAADEGMQLCYHHHMGTGVMFRHEVDRLMENTDPKYVHLLFDTGHLYWAGDDPLSLARDHGDRIRHVHLKDIRQEKMEMANRNQSSFLDGMMDGVFTVPGDGVIDFKPIFQALSDHDFKGWLVVEAEQDPRKAHPLTYAKMARSYLRDTLGF